MRMSDVVEHEVQVLLENILPPSAAYWAVEYEVSSRTGDVIFWCDCNTDEGSIRLDYYRESDKFEVVGVDMDTEVTIDVREWHLSHESRMYLWSYPCCDQCEMMAINGMNTHETGCPNSGSEWCGEDGWVNCDEFDDEGQED